MDCSDHLVRGIGTRALLAAVSDRRNGPDFLPGVSLEVIAAGVGREIRAGHLTQELELTPQGGAALARLRGTQASATGTLEVRRRRSGGCGVDWYLYCVACAATVAPHVPDEGLVDAIFDACDKHTCRTTESAARC